MVKRYDVLPGVRGDAFKDFCDDGESVDYTDYAALQASHDRLLEALKPLADLAPHYPQGKTYGNRPTAGIVYAVSSHGRDDAEITVENFHAAQEAIAAAQPFTET